MVRAMSVVYKCPSAERHGVFQLPYFRNEGLCHCGRPLVGSWTPPKESEGT